MIQLPNGCYCSDIKVSPANWKTKKADLKKNWYIFYRFYDPQHKAKYPKGKLIIVKGMNHVADHLHRVEATLHLLKRLDDLLTCQGMNPITNKIVLPIVSDLTPETHFIDALHFAKGKVVCVKQVKTDLKSVIKYVTLAAEQLRLDTLPIKEIRRKHVKAILERLPKVKTYWSANTHNTYRKYLGMMFKELVECEVLETNPCREISKQKVTKVPRDVLTPEQCKKVDDFVKDFDINFHRMLHIFFHSGMRTTEIFRVQGMHVNLHEQTIKCLMLKGANPELATRIITNSALPFWKEVMKDCKPTDFVFSKGLVPGPKQIRPEQVSRRWKRHVKDKLKITADWYALKHLHTDMVASKLSLGAAKSHNGQTSEKTTLIYAINERGRIENRVKELPLDFRAD